MDGWLDAGQLHAFHYMSPLRSSGYILKNPCGFSREAPRLRGLMGRFELMILSDLMESAEINETIFVSNQTLIFVTSYVSYLLVMRYLLWYASFQLYHLRASHILERDLVRPCMCNISGLSVPSWVREREGEGERTRIGRAREREIGSRLSDDLPLQKRYLSSILRLLSLMGQK